MLSRFDWLRRCQSGAELLATLRYLAEHPNFPTDEGELGPPHSATSPLCRRCWIYPQVSYPTKYNQYCQFCKEILVRRRNLSSFSRRAVIIWAFVNQLPKQFLKSEGSGKTSLLGAYVYDENHFLFIMRRFDLKDWLQELLMYHGANLKGLFQIFPTIGSGAIINMGDVLCMAIHYEAKLPMDRLRVQFYSTPFQLLNPKLRDRQGLLTFDVAEFLSLLERVEVFRTLLRPNEQKELYGLLQLKDHKEEQFYWGRFIGTLSQEAKDMLAAWKIRLWPKNQIELLYELVEYAQFH